MKMVRMFETRDGETFAMEGDAKRHAEECYGRKITEIANTLRDAFTIGEAAEGIGHYGYIVRDLEKFNELFNEAVALKRDRSVDEDEEG